MHSLAVSLTLTTSLACAAAAPLLAQRASCGPALSPEELPAVSAVLDSSSALTEIQAAKVLRDSMQFTLVLLPGDSIPLIAPLDSSDAMAAAVLARSVWPKRAGELWGLRVHVTAGATPAVTVSRATYCPPELTPASGPPVRMLPELREERVTSSTANLPRVTGPRPVPTIFEIEVSALGQVSKVRLVRSSGHPTFDSTAAQELERQTYAPALLDGIPVPAVYRTDRKSPRP